jgi:hypothetical protein
MQAEATLGVRCRTVVDIGILILCRSKAPTQRPIPELVKELRLEIAEITEANLRYIAGGKNLAGSEADHQRRAERLKQIMDELRALTDWKKL